MPTADPLLIQRLSADWGYTALAAARFSGEGGLHVLETFGDTAAELLQNNPSAFTALTRLWRLDPASFRLTTGPWNRAVAHWALTGQLDVFLDQLAKLSPEQLTIAETAPAALPLLIANNAPQAAAMIDRYGDRAWRLFMGINFVDSPPSAEKVAAALERYGPLMLDLQDQNGLSAALLLVSPETGRGSDRLPEVVKYACNHLDSTLAVTLFMFNYDDAVNLLDAGTSVESLCQSIDALAAQPDYLQAMAVEELHSLRLFGEVWQGRRVGAEAFRRCGPESSIAYRVYGTESSIRQAALVAMALVGPPALRVLETYRETGPFYDLLRRPELLAGDGSDPLLIHAIEGIAAHGTAKIDLYLHAKYLDRTLADESYPPSDSERYLSWLPLYPAYRAGSRYAAGLDVSSQEVLLAVADTALTFTPIKGTGKALSGAARLGERELAVESTEVLARNAGRQTLADAGETALRELSRAGVNLGRFGPRAQEIALRRLQARGEGLVLGLTDRRAEYTAAGLINDLGTKQLIAEEIGLDGAERYLAETGCEPLYVGKARQGSGFDLVARDGERIKVIEAKGGGSPAKIYHGCRQGTVEYSREVANDVLRRSSTTEQQKAAAREVLQAIEEQRLDVEVVRTRHVQGNPGPTVVESEVSLGRGALTTDTPTFSSLLAHTPGSVTACIREAGAAEKSMSWQRWLTSSRRMAQHVGVTLWDPTGPRLRGVLPALEKSVTQQSDELGAMSIATMEACW